MDAEKPQSEPPKITDRPSEHVIQPTQSSPPPEHLPSSSAVRRPAIDPSEIYPDATKEVSSAHVPRSSGSYWDKGNVSDKTIAMQVKALLALVILGFVSLLIALVYMIAFSANGQSVPGLGVAYFLLFIDGSIYAFLLFSKNANSVALVLKILLVLLLISVFGIFFGVGSNVSFINILGLLLTFVSLNQVRNLHRNF